MNSIPTLKYGVLSEIVEKRSLSSNCYKEWPNIRRVRKVSTAINRYERYQTKKYLKKKKQPCVPLEIGEKKTLQENFIRVQLITKHSLREKTFFK